jgi:hypothetical protein
MKRKRHKGKEPEGMDRQEVAVWLGRSMSTHEVMLRVVTQLVDIVTLQQQVIQGLYDKSLGYSDGGPPVEALKRLDNGLSEDLMSRLAEISDQISPILGMVDDSCQELEGML